jgi:DNA-binding beta-propeller fold protein YncE
VNHRIQRFSATGSFLGKWGSQGSGDGQFDRPYGVAVAADGAVYVADTYNSRIQRFSATGQFLGKWGSQGSNDGQFISPYGVAVAPDSTVYVADTYNSRVQRFSATGSFLGKWGSYGSSNGQFNVLSGVAVTLDGTVYVADSVNNRIQAFGTAYPTTWRGEYFANRWLTEAPALISQDAVINFNWSYGSPGAGVPADNFSARWQRYVWFDAGTYRFTLGVDDGGRLWVDDRLLIEAWQDPQVATFQANVTLSQGYHRVRLEYYEAGGWAGVQLSWTAL